MIPINLEISNMAKLTKTFEEAPQRATVEFGRALEIGVVGIVNQAIKEAPVGQYQGGNLKQSIGYKKTGPMEFTVFANAKYAGYVNFGTKPHVIVPVRAKVLANRRTGQIFGKIVHHPGTRAQPFFSDAVKDNTGRVNDLLKNAMDKVIRG